MSRCPHELDEIRSHDGTRGELRNDEDRVFVVDAECLVGIERGTSGVAATVFIFSTADAPFFLLAVARFVGDGLRGGSSLSAASVPLVTIFAPSLIEFLADSVRLARVDLLAAADADVAAAAASNERRLARFGLIGCYSAVIADRHVAKIVGLIAICARCRLHDGRMEDVSIAVGERVNDLEAPLIVARRLLRNLSKRLLNADEIAVLHVLDEAVDRRLDGSRLGRNKRRDEHKSLHAFRDLVFAQQCDVERWPRRDDAARKLAWRDVAHAEREKRRVAEANVDGLAKNRRTSSE